MRFLAVLAGPFRLAFDLVDVVRVVEPTTPGCALAQALGVMTPSPSPGVCFELAAPSGHVYATADTLVGVVDAHEVHDVSSAVTTRFAGLLRHIVETDAGPFFVVDAAVVVRAIGAAFGAGARDEASEDGAHV